MLDVHTFIDLEQAAKKSKKNTPTSAHLVARVVRPEAAWDYFRPIPLCFLLLLCLFFRRIFLGHLLLVSIFLRILLFGLFSPNRLHTIRIISTCVAFSFP